VKKIDEKGTDNRGASGKERRETPNAKGPEAPRKRTQSRPVASAEETERRKRGERYRLFSKRKNANKEKKVIEKKKVGKQKGKKKKKKTKKRVAI